MVKAGQKTLFAKSSTRCFNALGLAIVLLISEQFLAIAPVLAESNPDFPKIGGCEADWTNKDSIDQQLKKMTAYEDCVQAFLARQAVAAPPPPALSATDSDKAIATLKKIDQEKEKTEEKGQFLGWNWGIGVGASFGQGEDRIAEAEIVNNVVRVKKEVTDSPRIVLEIHNFIWEGKLGKRETGFGPFAAVNFGATDGDTLTAFGGGLMFGVKRPQSSGSFNVGLGYMLDQGVQILGDGFIDGEAPPDMETEVRFKEESQSSLIVFVSTTF